MHAYIHVPFCARRCAYCDFSIAVRRRVPVDEYLHALALELRATAPQRLHTLYLGGGTPSLLGGEGVTRLLDVVRSRYDLATDAEVTLECNPEDADPSALRAWRAAGVNRLSIGVQSFDDRVLQWMRRVHSAERAALAVDAAREAGFDNISLDLIFSLPAFLERDWNRDLSAALALAPEHVSLYGLTFEPSTPLSRWRDRGAVREAPEEQYEREYLQAHRTLSAAGFDHYEVSNFAARRRRSLHNSAYWSLAPYVGHGPAAHSFDGARRSWNEPAYARWIERLDRGEPATAGYEQLTREARELEQIYLGLRTSAGYRFAPEEGARVEAWENAGWAEITDGRVRLTAAGWLRLDALSGALTGAGSPCNV